MKKSAPGKNELTAHELTHTIQQGAAKRFNRQVRQLPEPQGVLVAKEIDIAPPYNNRQVRQFPLEEAAPQPQKAEPGFNRISRSIAIEEIPEASLAAKQFTSSSEPNFNKIQPVASEKLLQAELLEAKPLALQKKEGERSQSVSQTSPQIRTHLQNGLVAWLTGALGSTVSVPSKLDARGVVSLVLEVLNINYGRFRGLLAKRLGDAKVKRLESGFALMQRIASNGFVAAIQQMMQSAQQLQQLQQMVVEGIRNWVIETVVKQAVLKVVATFTGLGAIANVIQAIYNARSFFIEQASQITWEIKVHLTEQVQLEMEATNLVDTLARNRTSSGDLATLFPSKCVLIADF